MPISSSSNLTNKLSLVRNGINIESLLFETLKSSIKSICSAKDYPQNILDKI